MKLQNFDEIINTFKNPYVLNKYSKRNSLIISEFEKEIKNEADVLNEVLIEENRNYETEYKMDKILKILETYGKTVNRADQKFGIGNIVALKISNPYLLIELIIKAVLANCSLMFISEPTLIDFNMLIISILRNILKKYEINEDNISIVNLIDYKNKLLENKKVIDCIVVNKEYEDYYFFNKNMVSKVIYLDYGNINIYIDSDEYEEKIDKIVYEASKIEMDVYTKRINNFEEFLKNETNNFIFNTTVIFSKDIKKCMRLYEAIKSRNIFINKFDINEIETGLDINEFLFEKKVLIEDGK